MDRLVLVHVAGTATEGQLLRGRLETEDIPVFTKGEGDGPYRLGPMYLWVSEEHEVQARLILAEVTEGTLALQEDQDVDGAVDEDRDVGVTDE